MKLYSRLNVNIKRRFLLHVDSVVYSNVFQRLMSHISSFCKCGDSYWHHVLLACFVLFRVSVLSPLCRVHLYIQQSGLLTTILSLNRDFIWSLVYILTLEVLVTTIDALGHFQLQHSGRGWGDVGSARYESALHPPCPDPKGFKLQ